MDDRMEDSPAERRRLLSGKYRYEKDSEEVLQQEKSGVKCTD
jgi:hypothetical protein